MNYLGFVWARWRKDERRLSQGTRLLGQVQSALAGRSVALVGNARALANVDQGAQIDAADLVIRINAAPMSSAASHGMRTDWLAISTPVSQARLAQLAPDLVLWMTPKRKRIPRALLQRGQGFFLNPAAHNQRLRDSLGGPPTTGLMMIDLLLASDAREIHLYGFDFFASLSLSGRRTAAQVPHDFGAEAAFVEKMRQTDARLIHHAME